MFANSVVLIKTMTKRKTLKITAGNRK